MKRTVFLCLPLVAFLLTNCTQRQYNKSTLDAKFDHSSAEIESLVNQTKREIVHQTRDTVYNAHIRYILESAKFRLDSLEHSVEKYNRQTFQQVDSRLNQIIYETQQNLLELKEVAGEHTNSFYDGFAREVENS